MSVHPSRSARAKVALRAVKLTPLAGVVLAMIAFMPSVAVAKGGLDVVKPHYYLKYGTGRLQPNNEGICQTASDKESWRYEVRIIISLRQGCGPIPRSVSGYLDPQLGLKGYALKEHNCTTNRPLHLLRRVGSITSEYASSLSSNQGDWWLSNGYRVEAGGLKNPLPFPDGYYMATAPRQVFSHVWVHKLLEVIHKGDKAPWYSIKLVCEELTVDLGTPAPSPGEGWLRYRSTS